MHLLDRVKAFFSARGRANRTEYWAWVGVMAVVFTVAVGAATLFGDNGVYDVPDVPRPLRLALVILPLVLLLILAIKLRAVSGRRRNDAAVGDGFRRVRAVPILGRYLDFFTLGFLPSVKNSNEHGPGPGTDGIIDVFGDKHGR